MKFTKFLQFSLLLLGGYLTIGLLCHACSEHKQEPINVNSAEYLKKIKSQFAIDTTVKDMSLIAVNNPFNFNKQDIFTIYCNHDIIYTGEFSEGIKLSKSILLKAKIVHFRIEMLRKNDLFIFEDKSIIYLDSSYNFIYYGFFPSNPSTDRIHFFPQKNPVIQ